MSLAIPRLEAKLFDFLVKYSFIYGFIQRATIPKEVLALLIPV